MQLTTLITGASAVAACVAGAIPSPNYNIQDLSLEKRHKVDYKYKTFGLEIVADDKHSEYVNPRYIGDIPVHHVKPQEVIVRFLDLDYGKVKCKLIFEDTSVVDEFSFKAIGYKYSVKHSDEVVIAVECDIYE